MKKMSLFCVVFALLLIGCGQKGPLYLPQPAKPTPEVAKPAPVPKPVPASKQDTSGN